MSLPPVPSNVAPYIQQAATATKLPETVVAAQNYAESGYGSNLGPSSGGAEGPWQFLVSTWAGLGMPAGQENSWPVSTQAYIKYMDQLLAQENGNVRNALAAYNAGPGNLQAGYGYADSILAMAGQSSAITVGSPNQPQQTQAGLSDILGIPADIVTFFKDADSFLNKLLWLINPANWIRIGSFIIGILLVTAGIYALIKVSSDEPLVSMPKVVPIPV
jgi:hypothetical protein